VVARGAIGIISSADAASHGTKRSKTNFSRMVQIDVLEKPIKRIKETCAMMGIAESELVPVV
jgi:hypothetical protein